MSPSGHKRVFEEEELVDLTQFPDRIAETYHGKTVFVTGATGFVGKGLVEKLLHNTEVKRIYVLIKNKRGIDSNARFANYFDSCFFDSLRKDRPDSFKKVKVVPGNLSELDLGISREDRHTLIDEVDFVYHAGACVRFDEFLKRIVLLNVRGTRNMINLAKEMKHLELYVHISTTFCTPHGVVLKEQPVISPHDPHDIIRIVENMDETTLNSLTAKLVGNYGNTYTYSKALAEAIVFEQEGKLPIMVVRPSIVMPSVKYPIPGFTESELGPLTLMITFMKGITRVLDTRMDSIFNYVPLDMLVNTVFITTYNYINNTERKVIVCNATNFNLVMQDFADLFLPVIEEGGVVDPGLGHPNIFSTQCPFLFWFLKYVVQLIPAALLDFVMTNAGVKSHRSLMEIQRKIARSEIVLKFYTDDRHWSFENDTIRTLRMDLNEREDDTYALNIEELDLLKYMKTTILAIRRNILHEKDEDIPKAIKSYHRMRIIANILTGISALVGIWFTYTIIIPLSIQFVYYIFDV